MKLDSKKVFTPVQFTLESQEEYDIMLFCLTLRQGRILPSEVKAKLLEEMITCLRSG